MLFKDIHVIRNFFSRQVRQFGDHVHSLAWESDYTQKSRFWVLSEIAPLDTMRVLDVGCGKADLYEFFQKQGISVDYFGIDLTRELVDLALKKYPDLNLFYRDFLEDEYFPEVDYALSSGVANVRTKNNQGYMEAIIKKMFSIAQKGVAVNMLSCHTPEKQRDSIIYLYSPEQMFKFAMKLTPHVILRHDYLPNDFTLYLYKNR
ncbi:class I SAM-dependent methyltransferase [candidate division KSB1 bacterium]